MTWLRVLASRLAGLFRKNRLENDLDEEVRTHLEMLTEEKLRTGMLPEEARSAASRAFGGVEQMKEECRDAWSVRLIETLAQDIRYGVRQLRRSPSFTAVVVVTLALGLGANTALFSMVNGIILRALPFYQPQRLYVINEVVPQWSRYAPFFGVNSGNFLLWQRGCPAFVAMALAGANKFNLTGRGLPRQVSAAHVSANLFPLLGAVPQLGRSFLPAEEKPGRDHEVVLTDQLWRQVFNADPQVLGSTVILDDTPYTIVGVLPGDFRFPEVLGFAPEIFRPAALAGFDLVPGIGNYNYTAIVRLKPGVSPEQALAQLNVVQARIAAKGDPIRGHAPGEFDLKAMLTPLKTSIVGPAERALWMLEAAAALVLLIICVNLANLMLARNSVRARDVAVRTALGATRIRLMRQLVTEGLILGAAGGSLGLLLSLWGLRLLVRQAPLDIPRVDNIRVDPRVMLFTLVISMLAALLFTLLPAVRLAATGPAEALKSGGPAVRENWASTRLRGGLVAVEMGLSAALLAGALLLIQSLAAVARENRWMAEERVLALNLIMPPTQAKTVEQRYKFYSDLLEKVRALPGIVSAGFTPKLPLQGSVWGDDIAFREVPEAPLKTEIANYYFVDPGYFKTVGLPLVKGRLLSESDRGQDFVLISESLARRFLPGRDPIGMHLMWSANDKPKPRAIIGVVGDVRIGADQPPALAVYVPIWSFSITNQTLVVRTALDPRASANAIRRAVWSVNPDVAIPSEQTLETIVQSAEGLRRYETSLGGLFALCAVLLAAVGLYGVVSYSVSQRTHEFGVRMALGAKRIDVLRMVLRQGMKLAITGVAFGVLASLVLLRSIESLLYGVKPTDPLTFTLVAIFLTGVALLASYLPARRATKVDPIAALRYE